MIKAYNWSALSQTLFDILLKVAGVAVVALLNFVATGLSNGSIQLPAPALTTPILGLIVSQLDTFFVEWNNKIQQA